MRLPSGLTRCQWCRCHQLEACPQGCGWAKDSRGAPLCSACVQVDRAWHKLPRSLRLPNMRRAFFRGFLVGAGDERAEWRTKTENPYAVSGRTWRWWEHGKDAGAKAAA